MSMEPSDALAVQGASLRKLYGNVVAVDDVSFEVERGSVFCIIGPNGAGKTAAQFSSPDWTQSPTAPGSSAR